MTGQILRAGAARAQTAVDPDYVQSPWSHRPRLSALTHSATIQCSIKAFLRFSWSLVRHLALRVCVLKGKGQPSPMSPRLQPAWLILTPDPRARQSARLSGRYLHPYGQSLHRPMLQASPYSSPFCDVGLTDRGMLGFHRLAVRPAPRLTRKA